MIFSNIFEVDREKARNLNDYELFLMSMGCKKDIFGSFA